MKLYTYEVKVTERYKVTVRASSGEEASEKIAEMSNEEIQKHELDKGDYSRDWDILHVDEDSYDSEER